MDQKRQVSGLIEKSGLSASQFFLTLALGIPFKRPKKKTLPKATAGTILILEQLAGGAQQQNPTISITRSHVSVNYAVLSRSMSRTN
ncbi:hypothetical protein LZD49_09875 [Dyadobacter sp. CY261]|uniref:hypothetical protein n=1 Tax=Dyadobacter sp. CY261 TaxID=2907203 RepID=UPI001F20E0E8|nr:hypothetical protein [Dyadobacter sp. CY261]MCF0070780.1 hypothetical protein [Dyadobacter sp. CY261]